MFLVGCVLYLNTLRGEFVLDDYQTVFHNRDVLPSTPLLDIFKHDYWGAEITHVMSHKSYRPLTTLTFRFNYFLHGFDVLGYHLVNVILHGITSALLHYFLMKIVRPFQTTALILGVFVASLLFAAHPVHTESVANIAGRAELLGGMFYLLSLLFYWVAVTTPDTSLQQRWIFYFMTLCCMILSCLSKEVGFTLPPVLGALDVLLVPRKNGRILRLASLVVVALLLVVSRWYLVSASQAALVQRFYIDNRVLLAERYVRFLTWLYLPAYNAYLLLWPMQLSCDYGFNCIPFVTTNTDVRNLASLLLYSTLFVLGVRGFYAFWTGRDSQGYWRLVLFGLSWLVISFIPASNLLLPVGFVVAERVLYTPSMGFTVLLTVVFTIVYQRHPRASVTVAVIILAIYSSQLIKRNYEWGDANRLWSSALKVCPQSARVQYTHAGHLIVAGKYAEAIPHLKIAMDIDPEEPAVYFWLAQAKMKLNHKDEALTAATQSFLLQPYSPQTVGLLREILRSLPQFNHLTGKNDPFVVNADTRQFIPERIRNFLVSVGQYLKIPRLVEAGLRWAPKLVEGVGDIYSQPRK